MKKTKRNMTDIKPNAEPHRHLGPPPAIGLLSTTLDNACVLPLAHFTAHDKNRCAQFRAASKSLSNLKISNKKYIVYRNTNATT